ncbi:hypothetical protein CFRS1_v016067 [Colletotrichum fructicola]|nr:hypothetical protein CFRS1_v016067 [Colletotrichum fructicola]
MLLCEAVASLAIAPTHDSRLCPLESEETNLTATVATVATENVANEKGFILINSLVFVRTDILTSWRLAQASCLIQHSSIFPHGPACSWRLHLPNPLLDHHVP